MNKALLIYALLATALLAAGVRLMKNYRDENRRLVQNQTALAAESNLIRSELDARSVETQALRLRVAEFEQLRADDARRIAEAGIRMRRLEAATKTVGQTTLETRAPLRDTVFIRLRDTLVVRDTVRLFRWRDTWVSVEGRIEEDSVSCRVESVDTLRQIVYRIPRRFLFIRWGTKALRQRIVSTNPHTRIVAAEYVRIEK